MTPYPFKTVVGKGFGNHGNAKAGVDQGQNRGYFDDFLNNPGTKAVSGTQLQSVPVEGGTSLRRKEDEGLILQLCQGEAGGELLRETGDEHHAIFHQGHRRELSDVGNTNETQVDFLAQQSVDLFDGGHVLEGDLDVWMFLAKQDDGAGNKIEGMKAKAEAQATAFAPGNAPGIGDEVVPILDENARAFEEATPKKTQLRRASATDHQGAAEFFLQAANLLGQRGLTEVEKAGGPPEMKLSRENQERTHLCDIHSI